MLADRNFVVTAFLDAVAVDDEKGKIIAMQNRYASALIIPFSGKIKLTQDKQIFVADCSRPLFVPQGSSYINECLERAHSILFNFITSCPLGDIGYLPALDSRTVQQYYQKINDLHAGDLPENRFAVFSTVYALLQEFAYLEREHPANETIYVRAVKLMENNCGHPGYLCRNIAQDMNVSESYLYKLFKKYSSTSPYKAFMKIRLSKARALLLEKYPVKDAAALAGYADVYQFSRAYKKFYGHAPSTEFHR